MSNISLTLHTFSITGSVAGLLLTIQAVIAFIRTTYTQST